MQPSQPLLRYFRNPPAPTPTTSTLVVSASLPEHPSSASALAHSRLGTMVRCSVGPSAQTARSVSPRCGHVQDGCAIRPRRSTPEAGGEGKHTTWGPLMLIEVSCGWDDPDLHVLPGATLVILEGTIVLLDQGASIRVHPGGSLVVRGTARLPVTFAPLPEFSVHDSTSYPGKSVQ